MGRRRAAHALEEDGEIVYEVVDGAAKDKGEEAGEGDGAAVPPGTEDSGWDHGAVAEADLPGKEDYHDDARADNEADDGGAGPGVSVAAPLEGEEEADDGGHEEKAAKDVEVFDTLQDWLARGCSIEGGRVEEEEDSNEGDDADREAGGWRG